jgi:hypothetical protein
MKLSQLIEGSEKITVARPWSFHTGRRGKEFDKLYFNPFAKLVDSEMKRLKAKWNGSDGYEFKSQELADEGKQILDQFALEWKQLLADYPENAHSLDASVADEYFKHLKKNKLD